MAQAAKPKTAAKTEARPAAANTAAPRSGRGKPTRSTNPLRTFTLWVALPAVIVYLGGCTLVMLALHAMSGEMNRIEAERGRNAIAAAIQSVVLSLGEGVADEATWTEAYINTYVQPNPAWLDSAWGATARISDSYDTAIVTDVDGNIVFGETSRGPIAGTLAEHFSGAPDMLAELDASIASLGDDATVEHLSRNALGVVAIAGAVIHGNTGQASIPKAQRHILWLARQVDEKLLDATTDRFQLPTSRLVEHAGSGRRQHAADRRDGRGGIDHRLAAPPPGRSRLHAHRQHRDRHHADLRRLDIRRPCRVSLVHSQPGRVR